MSTRRTSRTARTGRGNISETVLAALLSKASHQATVAARSILEAGGSRVTALSTAQAAAQAVLCPSSQEVAAGSISLGRRRAKRHAEIIGSMVLMSLINSHQQQGAAPLSKVSDSPSHFGFSSLDVSAGRSGSERALQSSVSSKRTSQSFRREIPANLPKTNTHRSNSHSADIQQNSKQFSESNKSKHSSKDSQAKSSSNEPDQETRKTGSLGFFRKKAALSKKTVVKVGTISDPNQMSGFMECVADGGETTTSNSQHHYSYSSIDSEGDETEQSDEHAETLESDTVDRASTQGFMKRNVDPLLTTITNAFICGPTNAQTPPGAESGLHLPECRDERNARADGKAARAPPSRKRSSKITRNGESLSTYDSEQLLKDLNNSDSTSSTTVPEKRYPKAKKKVEPETMESVVLRALSTSPAKPPLPSQTNIAAFHSTDDVFAGIATDVSIEEGSSNEAEAVEGTEHFRFNTRSNKGGRFSFFGRRKKRNAKKSEF